MSTALLQTTYFGPIQWYQKLYRYDRVFIEQYDNYQKQTYRNRCVIASANGLQALTVPVEGTGEKCLVKELRISDHNQWRHIHWNALQSAYNESPFFEYYSDDIHPFFEQKYDYLIDFNEAICQKICELLDIHPTIVRTTDYQKQTDDMDDYRAVIHVKHPLVDSDFHPHRYWQVFEKKHGFFANLSILDLLFNMGNEAIFYL